MKKSFSKIPPHKIESWVAAHFEYRKRSGKNGEELVIENPFYHNNKKKFNISLDKAVCHDWRDDSWAGTINPETGKRNCSFIKFVRLYRKITYAEALREVLGASTDLSSFLRPDGRIGNQEAKKKVAVAFPGGAEPLISSEDPQARPLRKWLKSRGYTDSSIERSELHHLGMDVYWPYYEFDTLVYWQSRSKLNKRFNFPSLEIYDGDGNVIGVTDGSKGDFLYGFDDVEPASYLIITEAIFDQNTLGEQALASGGAALTKKQLGKIKILGPKDGIILAPDNDLAGLKSILSNHTLLSRLGYKVLCSLPPKLEYYVDGERRVTKDWNEIGEYVSGFDKVRAIHDESIRNLDTKELIRIRRICNNN